MKPVILFVAVVATLTLCETAARADEFPESLAKASSKMSLTALSSHPFHLKMEAIEKISKNPECAADIEVW